MVKRIFDFVIALFGIIALVPVFIIVSICVKLQLGSPVIFSQVRPGLHAKPFLMFKFRSMRDSRDAEGNMLPDSERLTGFGRFLRSSSLDELPGLVNVLRGELSLVGPRPLLMEYLPRYSKQQYRRHEVRPGLTGWAQVNGRNAISWEDKFQFDVWYVDNRSFWLDLKILFITVRKVLVKEGISADNHTTMPVFKGNQDGN